MYQNDELDALFVVGMPNEEAETDLYYAWTPGVRDNPLKVAGAIKYASLAYDMYAMEDEEDVEDPEPEGSEVI